MVWVFQFVKIREKQVIRQEVRFRGRGIGRRGDKGFFFYLFFWEISERFRVIYGQNLFCDTFGELSRVMNRFDVLAVLVTVFIFFFQFGFGSGIGCFLGIVFSFKVFGGILVVGFRCFQSGLSVCLEGIAFRGIEVAQYGFFFVRFFLAVLGQFY